MQTVTFYSYKGGTGRTLLLANVALLLQQLGRRVIALDLDLEAPGLPYKLLGRNPRLPGAVDWLGAFLAGRQPPPISELALPIEVSNPFLPGGTLRMLTAGRGPEPAYFNQLHGLQGLDDGAEPTIEAFLAFQQAIEEETDAEFLLIDSRTGITGTNVVTTRILPDSVVALTLDTAEQLEGTREVLRSLSPLTSLRTGEKLALHVVHTRAAASDADSIDARLGRLRSFLNEPANPLRLTLGVPRDHLYVVSEAPDLAARESLALAQNGRPLPAMREEYLGIASAVFPDVVGTPQIAAVLRAMPAERRAAAARFSLRDDLLEQAPVCVGVAPAATAATDAAGNLDALRELWRRDHDPAVRTRLISALSALFDVRRERGERGEAYASARELVDLARGADESDAGSTLASALNRLAVGAAEIGLREEALTAAQEAVTLYRQLADPTTGNPTRYNPNLAGSLNNLANQLSNLGRHQEALPYAEEAVTLDRQLAAARPAVFAASLARSLRNLAERYEALGRTEDADSARAESALLDGEPDAD